MGMRRIDWMISSIESRESTLAWRLSYWPADCTVMFFFFFQAEDGIRDLTVTGVQTCALPICQRDGDAAAWTSRAELLRKTGRSIDAVSAYDRAIGLTPKTLAPREGRLEALRSLARWDEVVKEASKVISLEPRHSGALYAKAHACIQLNRREEAVAALDGFLAVEPRSYDGLEAKRDLLLRTEQWSDLVVACDAILAIQPHHPRALKDKGRALLALGTAEAAYATFETLRVVTPDDLDALRG